MLTQHKVFVITVKQTYLAEFLNFSMPNDRLNKFYFKTMQTFDTYY